MYNLILTDSFTRAHNPETCELLHFMISHPYRYDGFQWDANKHSREEFADYLREGLKVQADVIRRQEREQAAQIMQDAIDKMKSKDVLQSVSPDTLETMRLFIDSANNAKPEYPNTPFDVIEEFSSSELDAFSRTVDFEALADAFYTPGNFAAHLYMGWPQELNVQSWVPCTDWYACPEDAAKEGYWMYQAAVPIEDIENGHLKQANNTYAILTDVPVKRCAPYHAPIDYTPHKLVREIDPAQDADCNRWLEMQQEADQEASRWAYQNTTWFNPLCNY